MSRFPQIRSSPKLWWRCYPFPTTLLSTTSLFSAILPNKLLSSPLFSSLVFSPHLSSFFLYSLVFSYLITSLLSSPLSSFISPLISHLLFPPLTSRSYCLFCGRCNAPPLAKVRSFKVRTSLWATVIRPQSTANWRNLQAYAFVEYEHKDKLIKMKSKYYRPPL